MTALYFTLISIFIILCAGWTYSIIKILVTREKLWLKRMWAFAFALNIDNLIIQILRIIMKN